MDERLCNTKEPGLVRRDVDGSVLEVKIKRIDWLTDIQDLARPMMAFHLYVNDDEIDMWEEIKGIKFHMVELICSRHRAENAEGYLLKVNGLCVGYIIGHYFADAYLFIRQIFIYPEWEKMGFGKDLVNAFDREIIKVIFQTKKELRPKALLDHVSSRATKVNENKFFNTWEMLWHK